MREIKFRAWDKEENNFIYFDATDGLKSECDETYIRLNVRRIDQYTGLKDKNGKEIYEGDILLVTLQPYGCPQLETFKVIWNDSTARYNLLDKNDDGWSLDNTNIIEVIGNIYENKELIDAD